MSVYALSLSVKMHLTNSNQRFGAEEQLHIYRHCALLENTDIKDTKQNTEEKGPWLQHINLDLNIYFMIRIVVFFYSFKFQIFM